MAATRPLRRRRRMRIPAARILLLGFFLVFVLVPLYWMFNTSIKPSDDYLAIPPVWWPSEPTLGHYEAALFAYRGLEGLINSIIVSTAATILSALLGSLMAYSLARYNTGGQHLSFWVLSQRFLPPIAVVLPIFLIYRGIGIYDTHLGLILAYTVFTLPVSVWMMYAYFRQMPRLLVYETLVHLLDTFRFLGGELTSVYCINRRVNPVIASEDQSLIAVGFRSGICGLIDANRISGPAPVPVAMNSLTMEGEAATLRLSPDGRLWFAEIGQSEREHLFKASTAGYKGDSVFATQQHLLTCLRAGQPSESDGRDYLKTVQAVLACYRSAETGQAVTLD